jgi:hypothetical protein
MAYDIFIPTDTLTVRQDGTHVLLLKNGMLIARVPWQAAKLVSQALRRKAQAAEETAYALRIAGDQAVLLRAGVPIGLTDHPRIQREAAHQAAWDRTLRRFMPGGVRSQACVGRPTVIAHPPKEESDHE